MIPPYDGALRYVAPDGPAGAPESAVSIVGLRHHFGALPVLSGVDLRAGSGEFLSIVGPSGCGKSTLLKVLAGLVVPAGGDARVGGADVAGRPGLVGYMAQRDLLLPWRRTLGNAILGAEVAGMPRTDAEAQARQLLERFGLAGFERAWPAELSGGMRQRLALLRTFLAGRDVLLLDEPFGALDAITRRAMYDWLQEVWLADRRTVLFVTHDVEEALFLADRVLVFSPRPGTIVAEVAVGVPRPRDVAIVTDADFVAKKARLLRALAGEAAR